MLDDLAQITKLDQGRILDSITNLPTQIEESLKEIEKLEIPKDYSQTTNVIVSGMGGSGLGARIVRYLMFDRLRVPIEYVNHYLLPNYTNKDSLVIISSYSGNTEETISTAYEAIKRNTKIIGMTTGGKLKEFFQKENIPAWIFNPKENPSNQPRMGLGYSIAGTLALLAKCNFLTLTHDETDDLITTCKTFVKEFGARTPTKDNIAKTCSWKIFSCC